MTNPNDDVSAAASPKSDQLNADDLIGGPITVTVRRVDHLLDAPKQKLIISIDGGYQPYKPCVSMIRVLIAAWTKYGSTWVGRRMTLFRDPHVTFSGVALGGVRISHLSGITGTFSVLLTTKRGKRSIYTVQPLREEPGAAPAPTRTEPAAADAPTEAVAPAFYPDDRFEKNLPAWIQKIAAGEMTPEQVIARAEQRAPLTAAHRAAIAALSVVEF